MKLLQNLQFVFRPSYWFMYHHYSERWNNKLNQLLDIYKFENNDGVSVEIGGYKLRHYLGPEMSFEFGGSRPSRLTILKAYRKLKEELEISLEVTYVNEKGQLS